jgi:hypothetical protein
MAALTTGLLVAVVAGLFGLGGAAFTARRDHDRWLRQSRLDAYSDFVAAVTKVTVSHHVRRLVREAIATECPDVQVPTSTEKDDDLAKLPRSIIMRRG